MKRRVRPNAMAMVGEAQCFCQCSLKGLQCLSPSEWRSLWSSKLLAILLRRTTLLCCSIERVLRLSIDSAVPSKLGGLGNGPTVQQHKPRNLRNLPTCYHLVGTSNITIPNVDGTGSQPAFFSRPRDVEDLSKAHHWLQRDVSMPVEQQFFNSRATQTMFFSHICRTLRSGTLSKWMRPVNRANVAFWHSTAGFISPAPLADSECAATTPRWKFRDTRTTSRPQGGLLVPRSTPG